MDPRGFQCLASKDAVTVLKQSDRWRLHSGKGTDIEMQGTLHSYRNIALIRITQALKP